MTKKFPPIKMIASDLDGTLLRSDRTVSVRVRAALTRARQAGITVALATARPPMTTKQFAADANLTGIAICSNGALIYDLDKDVILQRQDIDTQAARIFIAAMQTKLPDVCFAFVQGTAFACEPRYLQLMTQEDHGRSLRDVQLGNAHELIAQATTKIIVRHHEYTPDQLLEIIRSIELVRLDATHSKAPFVEVLAKGVSKAQGLATLCKSLNISAEQVLAFGDAPNDLAMLRWAGRGVAVANAHPAVLSAVNEITATNDDDGVAVKIEEALDFLLQESVS